MRAKELPEPAKYKLTAIMIKLAEAFSSIKLLVYLTAEAHIKYLNSIIRYFIAIYTLINLLMTESSALFTDSKDYSYSTLAEFTLTFKIPLKEDRYFIGVSNYFS